MATHREEGKPSRLRKDLIKRLVDYYNLYDVDYGTERGIHIHYGFYDSDHRGHHAAMANMVRILAVKAKITSKDIILDAGCGFGGSSIWLAKNIGAKVIGININERQVEKANRLAKKNKVDHLVKFYVDDFTNTKFPDETFDVVWGLESICYAENKKDFIVEAKRSLKKNGRLIVADGFKGKDKFTQNEQKIMEKWMEGWVVPNLASVSEFRGHLQKLKFKNIKFWDITKNVMPTSEEMYQRATSWFPLIKKLESAGLWTKAQTANVASAIYQYRLLKDKLFFYGIFYAEK